MQELNQFYLSQEEPNKSCLLALKHIILQQDTEIRETVKYGMPCFCYKNKAFCYLWTDKKTKHPYLLMVEGKYLDYPELETGTRSRMKVFPINPNEDLPLERIRTILNAAINLYRDGKIAF
nr:DUF1801 domain-containing protein [uncultured Sphingobacterium sp.]